MTLLIIMFYRQKVFRKYSQQFMTLFQEWDADMQKAKTEGEKLAVGIRLHFIITLCSMSQVGMES